MPRRPNVSGDVASAVGCLTQPSTGMFRVGRMSRADYGICVQTGSSQSGRPDRPSTSSGEPLLRDRYRPASSDAEHAVGAAPSARSRRLAAGRPDLYLVAVVRPRQQGCVGQPRQRSLRWAPSPAPASREHFAVVFRILAPRIAPLAKSPVPRRIAVPIRPTRGDNSNQGLNTSPRPSNCGSAKRRTPAGSVSPITSCSSSVCPSPSTCPSSCAIAVSRSNPKSEIPNPKSAPVSHPQPAASASSQIVCVQADASPRVWPGRSATITSTFAKRPADCGAAGRPQGRRLLDQRRGDRFKGGHPAPARRRPELPPAAN